MRAAGWSVSGQVVTMSGCRDSVMIMMDPPPPRLLSVPARI